MAQRIESSKTVDTRPQQRDVAVGAAFILLSASAFSLQGIFARLAYQQGAGAPIVGFGRFGSAAIILWLYALWRARRGDFPLRLPQRPTTALLALGAAAYFLGSLTYLTAVSFIPVSLAGLLLYTYPAIATVLAVVLGRDVVTRRLLIGLTLALFGVVLTLGAPVLLHLGADWRGVVLVLSSAVLYGGYIIGSERVLHGIHTVIALAYISTGASASFAVLTLFSGGRSLSPGLAGWGWVLAMGMVSTVIAAGTFLAALRRLGPARAATMSTIEPLITVIVAAFTLGERLLPVQLGGGLVILVGVVVVIRERSGYDDSL